MTRRALSFTHERSFIEWLKVQPKVQQTHGQFTVTMPQYIYKKRNTSQVLQNSIKKWISDDLGLGWNLRSPVAQKTF